jgi:hypothetical protein
VRVKGYLGDSHTIMELKIVSPRVRWEGSNLHSIGQDQAIRSIIIRPIKGKLQVNSLAVRIIESIRPELANNEGGKEHSLATGSND